MSTPLERINQLREETELAKTGDDPTLTGSWFIDPQHPHSAVFEVIAEDEGSIIVSGTGASLGAHIARWDPDAAGQILRRLKNVVKRHAWDPDRECCTGCLWNLPMPCPDLTDALAVLDQLDGGSNQ